MKLAFKMDFDELTFMKTLVRLTTALIFGLALILIPATLGHGQSEGEAAGGLIVVHAEDSSKSVTIKNGSVLKVWTTDGKKRKGRLKNASDSSFTVGTEAIPFSKTEKITLHKGEGSRIGGVVGIVLGAIGFFIGFVVGLIGELFIQNADTSADGCAEAFLGIFLLILGITIGTVGLAFLIIGLIAYAVGKAIGRSFRFDGKWRLRRKG